MKKNFVLLLIGVLLILAGLVGISEVIEGIRERGVGGVNYGRILFPFLLGGIALWQYSKHRQDEA